MNPNDSASTPNHRPTLMRSIRGPVLLVTLGTLFMIGHSGGPSFHRTWPVLLIVLGVVWLGEHMGTRNI